MLNDDTVFDAFLLASSQINHKRKALNLKHHLLTHLLLKFFTSLLGSLLDSTKCCLYLRVRPRVRISIDSLSLNPFFLFLHSIKSHNKDKFSLYFIGLNWLTFIISFMIKKNKYNKNSLNFQLDFYFISSTKCFGFN